MQLALQSVAALVAQDAPACELFIAVAREAGALTGANASRIFRNESGGGSSTVATWPAAGEQASAPHRSLGAAIVVRGREWGVITVDTDHTEPDAEPRLARFAELVAPAIASAEARDEATRLAQEQAALRRVSLVARESSRAEVLAAIAEETRQLLGAEDVRVWRYEHGPSALVLARCGEGEDVHPIGSRVPVADEGSLARVFETGRAVSAGRDVAAPILVKGRLWGAILTGCPGVSRGLRQPQRASPTSPH